MVRSHFLEYKFQLGLTRPMSTFLAVTPVAATDTVVRGPAVHRTGKGLARRAVTALISKWQWRITAL